VDRGRGFDMVDIEIVQQLAAKLPFSDNLFIYSFDSIFLSEVEHRVSDISVRKTILYF
jgi:hypothetical protein